ncbi:hypothetical protein PXO_03446 [Xanthomonas oryzae pv. oryzae PXO99A]|uniref:Uncharacterized protein n=1 Tax=Xanthomonas oryzae pv. oryzae (strain PXO99A) TaxID=360094 RepID=A0A0K0GF82_XANOP|nr:hypothetical protein PXO_03446 [Xanthomonas oryzae pv. oryzae PXO99A]
MCGAHTALGTIGNVPTHDEQVSRHDNASDTGDGRCRAA